MGKRLRLISQASKPKYCLPKKPRQGFVQYSNKRIRHGISIEEERWIKKLGVPISSQVIKLPGNKIIVVDGFDPKTNTIYEYLGDYWHKNPLIYKPDVFDNYLKKFNRESYLETINRFKILYELGYKIMFTWESWDKKGFMGRYYYYYDKKTNSWDNLL